MTETIKNGLMPKHPGFGIGRSAVDLKGGTLRVRKIFEEMPDAVESCVALAEEIKSEQREDLVIQTQPQLSMDDNGALIVNMDDQTPTKMLYPSSFALGQLSGRICPTAAKPYPYMGECWPELRATNVNAWLDRHFQTRKKRHKGITLRTRSRRHLGDELYAVVSSMYNRSVDVDAVATKFAEQLPANSRADVYYDGRGVIITVVLDETIATTRNREVFRPSIVLTTADDGTMGLAIRPGIWHEGSMGLLTYGEKEMKLYGGRHTKGLSLEGLNDSLHEPLDALIQVFRTHWDAAEVQQVISSAPDGAEKMFTYLVDSKHIRIPSIRRSELIQALVQVNSVLEEDLRKTKAGVITSLLELPHLYPLTITDEDLLFRQAGALLLKKFKGGEVA